MSSPRASCWQVGAMLLGLNVAACLAPASSSETKLGSVAPAGNSIEREPEAATSHHIVADSNPLAPLVIGISHEQRPIELHRFRPQRVSDSEQQRPPRILLLATIHGNEWAGTPLLERLVIELQAAPSLAAGRDVSIIAVLNPDGYATDRRRNAKGVDLNRNFPSRNALDRVGGTPLSEPESRALHDWLLREQPDLVISIHQPVSVVDWDGPAEKIARRMSETSGLPARRIGSRPGSLGSFLGVDHGVPVITLELPGGAQRLPADELWKRYGATLLRAVELAESQRSTFS